MSYKASDWAWSLDIPKASAKLVIVNLAYHARAGIDPVCAWPSVSTIARETGLHRETVIAAMRWLIEHKLIARVQDRFGRNGRGHGYVLGCNSQGHDIRPKNGVACFIGRKTGPSVGRKSDHCVGRKTGPEQVSTEEQVKKEQVNRVHAGAARGDELLRALSHGIAARA